MAGTRYGEIVRALRALTAVVALYALVMQAFLGGIAASAAASPFALPFDVHCLDKADGSERVDPSAPQAPAHHHTCCCTAASPSAGTPPPLPVMTSVVWPQPIVVPVIWRMEGVASARAPPFTLASARAPPVA
ncbi:hypothetical protein [Methylobacterium haplocladii]|nr:hypothetical protein [Methylobacterium haplocladii]